MPIRVIAAGHDPTTVNKKGRQCQTTTLVWSYIFSLALLSLLQDASHFDGSKKFEQRTPVIMAICSSFF